MSEKLYHIFLSVPLGQRKGIMLINESGGQVKGWLKVMNCKNAFHGQLSDNGELMISGAIRSLVSTIDYTASGTIGGRKILLNLKTMTGAYYQVFGEEFEFDDKVL